MWAGGPASIAYWLVDRFRGSIISISSFNLVQRARTEVRACPTSASIGAESATADFDARVSKDGHRQDRASGHPSRRVLRTAPLDEVREFTFHPVDLDRFHGIDRLEPRFAPVARRGRGAEGTVLQLARDAKPPHRFKKTRHPEAEHGRTERSSPGPSNGFSALPACHLRDIAFRHRHQPVHAMLAVSSTIGLPVCRLRHWGIMVSRSAY